MSIDLNINKIREFAEQFKPRKWCNKIPRSK